LATVTDVHNVNIEPTSIWKAPKGSIPTYSKAQMQFAARLTPS
jgi:hypothetical protein